MTESEALKAIIARIEWEWGIPNITKPDNFSDDALQDIFGMAQQGLSKRNKIKIIGKRWFSRTYGNTYHSVRVIVNGEEVGYVPEAYGYGDQYLQTAFALLQEKGFYPKTGIMLRSGAQADYCRFLDDMREHREDFDIAVYDVSRKKDL